MPLEWLPFAAYIALFATAALAFFLTDRGL